MGKIVIQSRKPFDNYIRKKLPQPLLEQNLKRELSGRSKELPVMFLESAMEDIRAATDWGRYTRRNSCEQGGILVGNFCDASAEGSEKRDVWVEVVRAIACDCPQSSSPVSLFLSSENWNEMYIKLNELNYRLGTNYVLVGWYHTHPNGLSTGFSGTDIQTHSSQFTFPYSIGAVFNPHRNIYSVFYGPDCQPTKPAFEERSVKRDALFSDPQVPERPVDDPRITLKPQDPDPSDEDKNVTAHPIPCKWFIVRIERQKRSNDKVYFEYSEDEGKRREECGINQDIRKISKVFSQTLVLDQTKPFVFIRIYNSIGPNNKINFTLRGCVYCSHLEDLAIRSCKPQSGAGGIIIGKIDNYKTQHNLICRMMKNERLSWLALVNRIDPENPQNSSENCIYSYYMKNQ